MITIPVTAGAGYDVQVASGLLGEIGERLLVLPRVHIVAVVTDDNVRNLYLDIVMNSLQNKGFVAIFFTIKPGEASKCAAQYVALLQWLAENKLTRADAIVALGGGVVGDLVGFAAATYLRGVPFIQIPTTLLAMVDSSVGGKTAIDLPAGKNLAGAFYQPKMVLCDPDVLRTLAPNRWADGFAEAIKHGMIADAGLLEVLGDCMPPRPCNNDMPPANILDKIIANNITIKRDIVQRDEFEMGERKFLNFGHTIAHAIEQLSDYAVSHGHAVAIGMAVITRAAVRKNICPPNLLAMLLQLLTRYDLPNYTEYDPLALFNAALHDKKRTGGTITEVIPYEAGRCELYEIPIEELHNWIEMGLHP